MAAPIFATQVKLGSNLRHAQHRIATVMDDIDRQLIRLLAADARTPLKDLAAGVGLSSPGTADRLRRLQQRGVIRSFAPTLSPHALGFPVTAFCTLEIRQRQGHGPVVAHLAAIPEVLEVHSITGAGDLLIRIVARDNADLGRVIDAVVDDVHVIRANTSITMVTHLELRTGPLVLRALEG